jgi:hypothetical protein
MLCGVASPQQKKSRLTALDGLELTEVYAVAKPNLWR